MPNKFKHNPTGSESDSVFSGHWSIDNSIPHTGGGPSTSTALFNGANIPNGGWALYYEGSVFITNNSDDLISRANELGAAATGINEVLIWASTHDDVIILDKPVSNTVSDGLTLSLDANSVASFVDNQPTTNLWKASTYNWTQNATMTRNATTVIPYDSEYEVVKIEATTPGTVGMAIPWTTKIPEPVIGDVYTHSAWVYLESGTYCKVGQHWNPWDYGVPEYIPLRTWTRVSYTLSLNSASRTSIANNYSTDGVIYVTMPQYEKRDNATPFVEGTRTQTTKWQDLSYSGTNIRTHSINGNPTFSNGAFTINETQGFNLPTIEGINQATNATVVIWYKTTDQQELWVRGNSGSYYIAAAHSGGNYYHENSGSPTYYIDAIQTANPTTSRNGKYHMFEAKNVNFTAWNQFNWFSYGSSWNMNGTVAKIMVYNRALTSDESKHNLYGADLVTAGLDYMWDAGNLVSFESETGSTRTYNLANAIAESSLYGTLVNGVSYNKSSGGHWEFDGSNDHILLQDSPYSFTLNQGNNWTVNAWVKTSVQGGGSIGDQPIMSNSQSGPVYSVFKVHNGRMAFSHYNNTWITTTGNKPISDNRWHLLTWVNIANGNMDMYIDGELDAGNVDARLSSSNRIDIIGGSWSNKFTGSIANVQVNSITMNSDQVRQNFAAQRNRFEPLEDHHADGGGWTKFWWYDGTTGNGWPSTETAVLEHSFGTFDKDNYYGFQRLPSYLNKDEVELLAVDGVGNIYKWDFADGSATAQYAWNSFYSGTEGRWSNAGAWQPTLITGQQISQGQDSWQYREEHGVKSFMLDDDNCDCYSTLSAGHGMCGAGFNSRYAQPTEGAENRFGVDALYDPGCQGPTPERKLELFFRIK